MKTLSRLFIIFGILWCLLGGYYLLLKNNSNALAFQKPYQAKEAVKETPVDVPQVKEQKPTRIVIKDLRIDLPIIPASISDETWETTNDGASYLVSSPVPGESGNSIVYGHNWANLFGNLIHAQPGHTVEVFYEDGSKKKFVIEYTSTVLPSASDILAPSKDKRLTLYTCTGFFDSKRFVAVALYDDEAPSFADITR